MEPTSPSPDRVREVVNLAAAVADLKERHYRLLLLVRALADALVARGLIGPGELDERADRLDREAEASVRSRAGASRSRVSSRRPRA